jgi:hypothetical protein
MTFAFSARLSELEDSQMPDGNPLVHVDLTPLQHRIVRMMLDESNKLPDRGVPDLNQICATLGITMEQFETEFEAIGEAWKKPMMVQ